MTKNSLDPRELLIGGSAFILGSLTSLELVGPAVLGLDFTDDHDLLRMKPSAIVDEVTSLRATYEESEDEDAADPDDVRRQEAIANAIRAVKPWSEEHGVSYDDAGGIVGYSESWVGDRVAEWREGLHRDLVEDPTDGSA